MARTRVLAAVALMACLLGVAMANVAPNAVLSKLVHKQSLVAQLAAGTEEGNPYGLAAITKTQGRLIAGRFLATNWNDAAGK
jgi:hypothetical protein